jgi:DNA primase
MRRIQGRWAEVAFPEAFMDELIARNDIVSVVSGYTVLKRQGTRHFGLCPFHNEKTPSFTVTPEKDLFYCFGCGKGGGVVTFIMEIEGLSFSDAVYFLARRSGMTVPDREEDKTARMRARILRLNLDAAKWYRANLGGIQGRAAADFLKKRRITPKTAARFGLGAAPDSWDSLINAMTQAGYTKQELIDAGLAVPGKSGGLYDRFRNKLIFPVIDVRGDIIGFGSRVLDDSKPKYVNSPDTIAYSKRRSLYGIHLAKNTKRSNLILCEGNIDVLTMHQAGFDNAVATMGTSLTQEQIKLISRYTKELVLCYDNDDAGMKATNRAIELLSGSEISTRVIRLPQIEKDGIRVKVDVDDFINLRGRDAFERLLLGSENNVEYLLSRLREGIDFSDDSQKVAYLRKAGELIAGLASPVEREVYSAREAEAAGVPAEAMRLEVQRFRKARLKTAKSKREREALSPARTVQPKERAIRYGNVRSAIAEEGVIRLIANYPEFIERISLEPGEFSSQVLEKAYEVFRAAVREGRPPGISCLEGQLTQQETSLLAHVLSEPAEIENVQKALEDYIAVIRSEREKEAAAHDENALTAILREYRSKKGYGG